NLPEDPDAENSNFGDKTSDAKYVLEENDQVEIEANDDNELENGDSEDEDDDFYSKE
ncbi:hypothetical protein MMC22_012049, partial [Lobaria immixta]|nr:hypothetical protein [Lobaria immixta]